jgi:hypothetical protein
MSTRSTKLSPHLTSASTRLTQEFAIHKLDGVKAFIGNASWI